MSARALLQAIGLLLAWVALPAQAIPAFAEQTGQPCSQCHVGAFGPQLKPYGRDFKLYGYTASDGESHLPGLALTLQSGFTHTADTQPGNADQGLKPNNNLILDQQISGYFGGRLGHDVGAFVQVTYDGTAAAWQWDNTDVRYAHATSLFGRDAVFGLTLNNSPTVQDLWNSTPVWGFPYNASSVAATPASSALLDGGLGEQVLGLGAYAVWNDLVYAEFASYRALNGAFLNHLGTGPNRTGSTDIYSGAIPYLRLALMHETDEHYLQAGFLALDAARLPGGDRTTGLADRVQDRGIDANYAWKGSDVHYVSAHALWLRENLDLAASQLLTGSLPHDRLDTLRADLSYSWRNTWTPTVQWFRTTGSADPVYWGTAGQVPDSRGQVFEIAWSPLGKPESLPAWLNLRAALQFVRYDQFDGDHSLAAQHNTAYLSFWFAFSPTYALEARAAGPAGH